MPITKTILIPAVFILCLVVTTLTHHQRSNVNSGYASNLEIDNSKIHGSDSMSTDRINTHLMQMAALAKPYILGNSLNPEFCILMDMSRHSGLNRLFIWDLKNDTLLRSALCAHGCCDQTWGKDDTKDQPVFSNVPESYCSSIGKYKIGKRGYSNWGINVNYKLHGLDSTNSNAFKRLIVLHSWDAVGDEETYPDGTVEGWGCPAVSNETMRYLDKILKDASKPVLFWMYRE